MIRLSLFLAILFACYFSVALQGIPYEQMEGVARGWNLASQMPWSDFFYYLLRPVSTALTSSGQHLIDVRVSESIIQKGLFVLWGESMTPMLIMNVIASAALVILFFYMVWYFTKDRLASFLATVFLFTTPAYLWVVMEYGDYAPTDQVFLLSYFFFFFYLMNEKMGPRLNQSGMTFAGKIILLWFLGMVAINAKEPNKFLVPAVSWVLLFFNPDNNLKNTSKRRQLLAIAACILVLSLPLILVQYKSSGVALKISWLGPIHQFFFQPDGWEDEKTICLFTLKRTLPVSVLANFGFFLAWPMLILLVLRLARVIKGSDPFKPAVSAPIFLSVWLFISCAFYLIQDSDTYFRYITWALMPFTIVVAIFFVQTVRFSPAKIRKFLALALCGLVIFKITDNFQHSLFFRRQLEKIWVPKWSFYQKIYEDYTHTEKAGLFKLYDFWSYDPYAAVLFPYMPPGNMTPENLNAAEFMNRLKENKKMYFVSYSEISQGPGKITQLAKMDVDRLSALSAMRAKRKKKPASFYYLYRIDEEKTTLT